MNNFTICRRHIKIEWLFNYDWINFYLHHFPFRLECLLFVSSTLSEDINLCYFFRKIYPKLFGRQEWYTHTRTLSCIHSHTQWERSLLINLQYDKQHSLLSSVCWAYSIASAIFLLLFSFHFFVDQRHCSLTLDVLCWKVNLLQSEIV